mmetsp:Transcript_41997/g.120063  ORF Transcript_41997/g.120063 Transcript_41997/m.120063 type:complete len:269 (+) Transcript_41997:1461-2267(+)
MLYHRTNLSRRWNPKGHQWLPHSSSQRRHSSQPRCRTNHLWQCRRRDWLQRLLPQKDWFQSLRLPNLQRRRRIRHWDPELPLARCRRGWTQSLRCLRKGWLRSSHRHRRAHLLLIRRKGWFQGSSKVRQTNQRRPLLRMGSIQNLQRHCRRAQLWPRRQRHLHRSRPQRCRRLAAPGSFLPSRAAVAAAALQSPHAQARGPAQRWSHSEVSPGRSPPMPHPWPPLRRWCWHWAWRPHAGSGTAAFGGATVGFAGRLPRGWGMRIGRYR